METLKNLLPVCGIISVVFYFLHVVLGTLLYPGYNPMSQAVSDLTASNSPSRNIAFVFSLLYGLFSLVFSIYFYIYFKQAINTPITLGAAFLCLMTIVSFGYTFFPLSESGYAGTFQDKMHMAVTAAVVLCTIISLVLFTIGFFKTADHKLLGFISAGTFLLLLTGSVLMKLLPREFFGIAERINVYAIVLYIGILSWWMNSYIRG
jgi:hypothetical membrane protein